VQGLAYALQTQESQQRAKVLGLLAPHLPDELLPKLLAAVNSMAEQEHRTEALRLIAQCRTFVMINALQAVYEIGNSWALLDALEALAPNLPKDLIAQALEMCLSLEKEDDLEICCSRENT